MILSFDFQIAIVYSFSQSVMFNLRQSDTESEKFSEEGSDISHLSSETRISMNVQQVTSRYHAIQNTVKVGSHITFLIFFHVL